MGSNVNAVLKFFQNFLEDPEIRDSSPTVVVRRQYVPSQSGRGTPSLVVQRAPTPYWEERGWRQQGSDFLGMFQTPFGSWPGCLRLSPSGRIEVFVQNPPSALQRHPHWPCFRLRSDGWYFVHPVTVVPDISAGILGVEKTINEAYAI